MPSIFITGSNRGLGLEWARQYAEAGWRVFASCREPELAHNLQALAADYPKLSIPRLDVCNEQHISTLHETLAGANVDVLINNAGVYFERWGKDKLGAINYDEWLETYRVNVLGAVRVTEALRHAIAHSDKRLVVMVTSHMGSLHDISAPNDYAYRSSKAALNAVVRGLIHELLPSRIGILLTHPGWVRTRMGGEHGRYSVTESVSMMRRLVDGFQLRDSGRFFRCDGETIPW